MTKTVRQRAGATADELLMTALEAAVPLHIAELRGRPAEWLIAEASRCATVVGSQGDVLQYGGAGCASAFNALARGLAITALVASGGLEGSALVHDTGVPLAGRAP